MQRMIKMGLVVIAGLCVLLVGRNDAFAEEAAGTESPADVEQEPEAEPPAEAEEEQGASGSAPLRQGRIDMTEDRVIQGQVQQAGSLHVRHRAPRSLPMLVTLRTSFRPRIVGPVLGPETARPQDPPKE